jgi:hypothetical protein
LIAALDARAAGGGGLGVGGSAAQVNSARTHVMFYLAQVRVILGWPFGPVSYPKAAVNLCTNLLGPGYLSLSQGFDPTALYSPPPCRPTRRCTAPTKRPTTASKRSRCSSRTPTKRPRPTPAP